MRLIEVGGGGVLWLVERALESGQWSPIGQEDLRSCSRVAQGRYMAEVNAVRSYRPREILGGTWAALLPEHAQMVQRLLERSGVPADDVRTVQVTVTRRIVE